MEQFFDDDEFRAIRAGLIKLKNIGRLAVLSISIPFFLSSVAHPCLLYLFYCNRTLPRKAMELLIQQSQRTFNYVHYHQSSPFSNHYRSTARSHPQCPNCCTMRPSEVNRISVVIFLKRFGSLQDTDWALGSIRYRKHFIHNTCSQSDSHSICPLQSFRTMHISYSRNRTLALHFGFPFTKPPKLSAIISHG